MEATNPSVYFLSHSASVVASALRQGGLGIGPLFAPLARESGHSPHDILCSLCWASVLCSSTRLVESDSVLEFTAQRELRLEHTKFVEASLALVRIEPGGIIPYGI